MSTLFLRILNMSISAGWLVMAVLLVRFALKKAPKWINVLLWGIVAIKLICPVTVESPVSLIPDSIGNGQLVSHWMDDYIGDVDIHHPDSIHYNAAIGAGRAPISDGEGGYYVVTKHDQLGEPSTIANTVIPVLSVIWASGMALFVLYSAISYWRLRHRISEAVILRDNIYQCENVGSPFVLGILRPKIYLPYHMDDPEMHHVICHEQAHIHRRDHWWKPFGFLLLTIHWFNPLMWVAYSLLCRDIELACDEKVIKELDNEQRADYTQALVACSVNRRLIAACPLAFGEVGVKERVKSMMNYKKPTVWIIVLSVIVCAVVSVCFLTNPVGFQFDQTKNTIVSATHFDMRSTDAHGSTEMNSAQLSELSSRLAGIKNTKSGDKYAGLKPGYQISARLQDDSYIRISGYSMIDTNMVDIEWNKNRYVVSDRDFQDYLARICAGGDTAAATRVLSLNDVIILSQKGYDLTWADFESYDYLETGSGLYIRVYRINDRFELRVGSATPHSDPTYIYLTLAETPDTKIDIRDGGVTEFISEHRSDSVEKRKVFATEETRQKIQFPTANAEPVKHELTIDADGASPLERAISKAILDRSVNGKPDGLIHVESHVLLANETMSGTPQLGVKNHMDKTTAFLLVLHQKYSTYGGKLEKSSGNYIPTAITFNVSESGEYALEEYWTPRDGSYYSSDIRSKFPGASADDALNAQAYIEELEKQCYSKALAVMDKTGSLDFQIEKLLNEICASPSYESDPAHYTQTHEAVYQELVGYGAYTLRYCYTMFLENGQTGLKGHIMALLCQDIMRAWGEGYSIDQASITGQAWFDEFLSSAENLSNQLSREELEKYYPATFLLLTIHKTER